MPIFGYQRPKDGNPQHGWIGGWLTYGVRGETWW